MNSLLLSPYVSARCMVQSAGGEEWLMVDVGLGRFVTSGLSTRRDASTYFLSKITMYLKESELPWNSNVFSRVWIRTYLIKWFIRSRCNDIFLFLNGSHWLLIWLDLEEPIRQVLEEYKNLTHRRGATGNRVFHYGLMIASQRMSNQAEVWDLSAENIRSEEIWL